MSERAQPVAATRRYSGPDRSGVMLLLWCPGCEQVHGPNVEATAPPVWTWDGNLQAPTLEPSILVTSGDQRCHSFLRAGVWQFLTDSTHDLAGQNVPMVPLPRWLIRK